MYYVKTPEKVSQGLAYKNKTSTSSCAKKLGSRGFLVYLFAV